jgi:hypothetical protein
MWMASGAKLHLSDATDDIRRHEIRADLAACTDVSHVESQLMGAPKVDNFKAYLPCDLPKV